MSLDNVGFKLGENLSCSQELLIRKALKDQFPESRMGQAEFALTGPLRSRIVHAGWYFSAQLNTYVLHPRYCIAWQKGRQSIPFDVGWMSNA